MSSATPHPTQDLSTLPDRMRDLPIAANGWIVPWFVARLESGEPEFRAADYSKWVRAVRQQLCWVCGRRLGKHLAFVIGPMCAINRTTAEPPCHRECARWSARNCPFLTRPHMRRREAGMPEEAVDAPGCGLSRNPGVAMVWVTYGYHLFEDQNRRPLIRMYDPVEVEFYTEGRPSTRAEVEESVRTGLPFLEDLAREEPKPEDQRAALEELAQRRQELEKLYPDA